MLTCLLGENKINLFDNKYDKNQLKKWAEKDILICEVCGKPYEYCHGKVKMPYFRHKDKQECFDLYSEQETQEHIKGKIDLYNWLLQQKQITEVILEGWIPYTKQRPDIMFKYNGKQHVIEYQCTPISGEYYERHELYKASDIKDIWVLGTLKYFQMYHDGNGNKRVSEIEKNTPYYYDTEQNMFFHRDIKIPNRMNKKTYNLIGKDFTLYDECKQNVATIKDSYVDYEDRYVENWNWHRRHLPKTSLKRCYNANYSRAYCRKINEMKLGGNKWLE